MPTIDREEESPLGQVAIRNDRGVADQFLCANILNHQRVAVNARCGDRNTVTKISVPSVSSVPSVAKSISITPIFRLYPILLTPLGNKLDNLWCHCFGCQARAILGNRQLPRRADATGTIKVRVDRRRGDLTRLPGQIDDKTAAATAATQLPVWPRFRQRR